MTLITQYSICHRKLCSSALLKNYIYGHIIDIPIPVSLYGVQICIALQVIDALVVVTVAHPVQLLAVIITVMSLLYAVSVLIIPFKMLIFMDHYYFVILC